MRNLKKRFRENVLVISDTHIPFEHRHYLEFCVETKKKFKCSVVRHIGDLVDNHAISYHDTDPNGYSAEEEAKEADKHLKSWFKAFPNLQLCIGNHDPLVERKSLTYGLPQRVIKEFQDIWHLPKGWEYKWQYQDNKVKYFHGLGFGGKYPHVNAAIGNRQSVVIGHFHTVAGVEWMASERDIIFAMAVGCGIDRKTYAFKYGKDFIRKPILSCGVVLNNGEDAQVVPMKMT